MLTTVAVQNYRSLQDLVLPLAPLTVVTGANGSGKTGLYRSLQMIAAMARDGAVGALAAEGGLGSVLYAGPDGARVADRSGRIQGRVGKAPVALRLGFTGEDLGYAVDFGLPVGAPPGGTKFVQDPEIKNETIWAAPVLRPSTVLVERGGPLLRARDEDDRGRLQVLHRNLAPYRSILTHAIDPVRAPEPVLLADRLREWRFYDSVRTDRHAPARVPRPGTRTPVLASDGSDVAAALQTILENGDDQELRAAVDAAFPGSRVEIAVNDGLFEVQLWQRGVLRPLRAVELSDGTLRYLLWAAALLTLRPPELMVLNEPETSLHPDLLPALGALIAQAAGRCQVLVITHARALVAGIAAAAEALDVRTAAAELIKTDGRTAVADQGLLDGPSWRWPSR
ncbi:AAA family ATPase [Nakamurella sp. YIM 132087]|uniref:AAA family ATPase n=1 Tax=Nakamurella alba TaxID=2665158 RepID=A0A7K1FJM9_9ACTN|nr:AAA family ATPase [Nakamurella alba]MTD14308.1 AAA family ATPase [Nakamurella alba]